MTTQTKQQSKALKIGDIVTVHGIQCEVFKIRPFGTVDVVALDYSRAFRVSGLPMVPAFEIQ